MIKTFYHTECRAYITADVVDLGMVDKLADGPPAIGGQLDDVLTGLDAIVAGQPDRRNVRDKSQVLVEAAQEQPGTIDELAERTGLTRHAISYYIRLGHLVRVGKAPGAQGQYRSVWGASC